MAHGDGSIYQRGATWWARYYLRGIPYRESTHTSDEKEAAKFLRARLKQKHGDEVGGPAFVTPQASRLTITELVAALKADFELRGKLSMQNASHFRRVERDFGQYRAAALTAERIDSYVETRLADGDAPASINRTTQILGQSFALAIRRNHLVRAPYIRHLSERGNERQGFFSEAELRGVIENLPADLRDFARFAAATGMRKGECASLRWNDLDGDVLTLRGENSKNGDSRAIPLAGELAAIIARRQAARRITVEGRAQLCELIFHRDGAPVERFNKSWATACRKAGVSGKLFHDLRRSAVRNMTHAGVPQAVAMKISGHKTASMFARYNIVATDDLRTALARTEEYRATAAKQKVVAMR